MTLTNYKYLGRLSTVNMMIVRTFVVAGFIIFHNIHPSGAMTHREKQELRAKALEMFHHAYRSYMDNAYPADELMPLSCKGRFRGTQPSRGDIDDALGNFSLTLIDTLDTLVVLGEVDEFERAVRLVVSDINFDSDIVVSVFETNIRVMGGLLGGHLMADLLKRKRNRMQWYNNELLNMAEDLGGRLLPAFNTSTGMPYPRVNLRYGVKHEMSRTGSEKDTCTACAGTMLLEFSALSRLTGNKLYEEKAARAMDYLWESRHRASDLVGTVINIHNGDWVRRESGIGAGIDSYYEYLLKGYIMLGKDTYLERFNKHYKAVMKYVSNGPLMLDVHMHRPQMNSRNFMDALLAFWPGLQVLKGDLKSAIEIHEMLYQVTLRHNFLPEAFTSDFRVHWAQHPLRPEFLESTYFIYKATGDPYYLEVGKSVIENLDRHARVPCGFAALKDVTTGIHEDQMDSYVLAETFKYLYLLFSDKEDLILNVDDYVFTTEAHLLPLFLSMRSSMLNRTDESDREIEDGRQFEEQEEFDFQNTCPSTSHLFKGKIDFAHHLRSPLKNLVENLCPKPKSSESRRLKASEFMAGNKDQIALLNRMGIRIITMADGRVQLLHLSNEAASPEDSAEGLLFMQEMIEMSKAQSNDASLEPRVVQLMSPPFFGNVVLKAGPAQFGVNLKNHPGIEGPITIATSDRGCQPMPNKEEVAGKFVMVERGDCMFVDKARHLQNAGAIGGIIFDNNSHSSADSSPLFSMSGDGKSDITIPLVFLFHSEARVLREALTNNPNLVVYVSERFKKSEDVLLQYLSHRSRSLAVEPPTALTSDNSGERQSKDLGASSDSHRETDDTKRLELEAGVKDLIVNLLRKVNLEKLEPFIKARSQDKLDSRISGSFQVRIIQMPENSDGKLQMEMRNEEEAQRLVKVVFAEFLLLLMECTNLKQLKELGQIMDALARLTESVFTSGQMGYGVHTETLISGLKDWLVILETCSPKSPLPAVPEVRIKEEGVEVKVEVEKDSFSMTPDGVQVQVTLSRDDSSVVSESQELRQMVGKFVEDQLGILMQEMMMDSASATSTSSVEVVVGPGPLILQEGPNGEDSECTADRGSLFLDGYRLENNDQMEKIRQQISTPSQQESSDIHYVSERDILMSDDVTKVCEPDTVVHDISKLTISDTTGEPVVLRADGSVWRHSEGCWMVEKGEGVSSEGKKVTAEKVGHTDGYVSENEMHGQMTENFNPKQASANTEAIESVETGNHGHTESEQYLHPSSTLEKDDDNESQDSVESIYEMGSSVREVEGLEAVSEKPEEEMLLEDDGEVFWENRMDEFVPEDGDTLDSDSDETHNIPHGAVHDTSSFSTEQMQIDSTTAAYMPSSELKFSEMNSAQPSQENDQDYQHATNLHATSNLLQTSTVPTSNNADDIKASNPDAASSSENAAFTSSDTPFTDDATSEISSSSSSSNSPVSNNADDELRTSN